MADPALKGKSRGILDVCVIVFVAVSLTYWLLFAVFLPVIALGANNYNLARLSYAETGGFFGNRTWSDPRQIVHPWAFDAVHLPFLKLGIGFGLPSFVCMIGCLFVAWRIISAEYDRSTAWFCVAALLALPPIVFQGTVTKNDFGVAFGVACWFYAYWLHRRERLPKYAVFMAVGLGFAAGAKTTGLQLGFLLGVVTLVLLFPTRRSLLWFVLTMPLSLVLLGSIETYVLSDQIYGSCLGPDGMVRGLRNNQGVSGTLANYLRYGLGTLTPLPNHRLGIDHILLSWCRSLLKGIHLADSGYAVGFGDDATLSWPRRGRGFLSYGILGGAAWLFASGRCLFARQRNGVWWLAICGTLILLSFCYSLGWTPLNYRYLLVPFALMTLSLVLSITQPGRILLLRKAALFGVIVFATLTGISSTHAFNKLPDILCNRENLLFRGYPMVKDSLRGLRDSHQQYGFSELGFVAGERSFTLPFFLLGKPRLVPLPASLFQQSAPASPRALPEYIFLINTTLDQSWLQFLTKLQEYPTENAALYRSTDAAPNPK